MASATNSPRTSAPRKVPATIGALHNPGARPQKPSAVASGRVKSARQENPHFGAAPQRAGPAPADEAAAERLLWSSPDFAVDWDGALSL